MNEKHPLDDFFREGLAEHKLNPSGGVWEKVAAQTEAAPAKRAGGWYILRAAVVTILLGLSTFVYFYNNDIGNSALPAHEHNKEDKSAAAKDKKEAPESKAPQKSEDQGKAEKNQKKVVPIMRQSSTRQIYVSNELPLVDEKALESESDFQLASVELKTESDLTPIRIKMKVPLKATTPAYYADAQSSKTGEKKPDLKDKVYTYASTQLDNIVNGKPLEWPKAEGKPQLEIGLPRIFQ